MDDELDAWLFGDPTALLATNNPYADILSQFPEDTNLDDYVVTENGLIRNTAGDTGTFKDGKWIPYTGGDVKTFLTGSSASRFLDFAKRAKDALSSPQGIAGLAGAALGFLDRPKPSGGGTTMAYPGAAKLERKMVQGPYGPLAEYTGVGGGTPDYTSFTAPQVQFPTVGSGGAPSAGAGMSMQAKIDLYKQLRGYGLSDERVRRIAETMFGVQTDSDWSELTRRAGVTTGGIAGQKQKPSTDTTSGTKPSAVVGSQTLYTDPSQQKYKPSGMASWLQTSLSPIEKAAAYNAYLSNDMTDAEIRSMAEKNFGKQPDSDWAELKRLAATLPKNLLPSGRSFTDLELKGAVKKFLDSDQQPKSAPREEPSTFTGPPSLQVSQSSTPQQKAQEYQRLRQFGMSDSQIRAMAEAQMGKQTDSDWRALRDLAGETAARATGRQTSFDDPFVTELQSAMGQTSAPFSFTDPTSKSTITTKTGYTGVPYEYTFTDQYGKSETIAGNDLSAVNKLAQQYKVDLSKAFAAQTPSKFDASKYAVVGQYGLGIPLETIYSSDVGDTGGLTFRSLVEGPKLGSMSAQFYDKPLQEVEAVLKKYKQNPPKTEQELIEANSAWSDYSDRFRNPRNGQPPLRGGFDSSLSPIKMLPKTYEEYGSLNDLLSDLSRQVSQGTQNEFGLPNTREAELLNSAITILDKNPIIAQTIDRIKQLDPNVKINSYDIGNLNARIAEVGTARAVQDFISEKRNMVGFYDKGSEPFFQRHTMADPTYRAYSNLLNEVSSASASNVDQSSWETMAKRTSAKNQTPVLWRDPNSGQGIGMILGEDGQPKNFTFYGADGTALTSSIVSAPELYKKAELFGIDLSGIGELGNKLDKMGVKYKPNELYAGSDAGVDLQDIARGGMGSAFDWTKDPMAHLKGPSAISSLATNQALAQRLGVGAASGAPMGASTATQTAAQPASQVTTQPAAQVMSQPATQLAAQPAAQPAALRDLKSLLPSDWGSITDPSKKIDWFNQKKATEDELKAAGVKPEEIAWMRQNKLGTYASGGITQGYAHGGEARAYAGGKPLTMEDGGFVFTKKATDKLGRRGIAALGGKMISAPGNGTDDRGITGIIGKNGVTPARVSNGEAYIPPGRHDTKKLYALMHSLERKA